MTKKLFPYSLMAVLILTVVLTGCGGGNSGGPPPASFSIAESLVTATTTNPITFPTDTDDSGSCTVNYSYYIAKYEVTYQLWKEVYDWAQSHEYIFTIGSGKRGGGYDKTNNKEIFLDTDHDSDPATYVNWYDAVVWCNALTEYYNAKNGKNLDCVYKDAASNVIKNSTDNATKTYLDGLDENNFNRSAKGFRLPTSMEWELAAWYKDGSTWTPGNYASGATGPYTDVDATKAVAWYWGNSQVSSDPYIIYSTHPVGQKPTGGNTLGLYDMCGNVWEWCFDKSGSYRGERGGCWFVGANNLQIGVMGIDYPDNADSCHGFRLVRTQ